jgi:hypothetical protein
MWLAIFMKFRGHCVLGLLFGAGVTCMYVCKKQKPSRAQQAFVDGLVAEGITAATAGQYT